MRAEKETKYQILYNLRRMMRAEKDLDLLLDFIVQESAKIVNADRATLFLYEEDTNQLISKIALGTGEIVRFDSNIGIAGEVFHSGKVQNLEDVYKNKKFNPTIDKKTGYKTKSVLCVPINNIEGKAIGVLEALNKMDGVFTSEDIEILEIFSSNAAVAIDNARLINDLAGSRNHLEKENKILKEKNRGKFFINNLIGTSTKVTEVLSLLEKVARSPLDILITGESGTGKELAARMVHINSSRPNSAFVDLNCAALPDSILESELFGIEKGVATGVDSRTGKIEMANGGTLFLDEIGDMSIGAQSKLLRALQERKITRLGGKKSINVDFRVVAATNKNLQNGIKEKTFREDLYYRLNVVHIRMPALREIKEDIPLIAKHFLINYSQDFGKRDIKLSDNAINCLLRYSWPGNVRELENEIKRAIIMADNNQILETDISSHIRQHNSDLDIQSFSEVNHVFISMKKAIESLERKMINNALSETDGNKQKASELLGITRQGLFKKMKRYNL